MTKTNGSHGQDRYYPEYYGVSMQLSALSMALLCVEKWIRDGERNLQNMQILPELMSGLFRKFTPFLSHIALRGRIMAPYSRGKLVIRVKLCS